MKHITERQRNACVGEYVSERERETLVFRLSLREVIKMNPPIGERST